MQNCPASLVTARMLSCVRLFATPRTVACQAPLSMGFSKRDYWSGLPFPPPGDLPHPGIKLASPAILSYIVVQWPSCVRLFATPMDCSTLGFPVLHYLPEFAQTHVHWVGDGIQPSHSLLSPSPPAFNLSQHQGLFQWVSSLHQVAKVLEF